MALAIVFTTQAVNSFQRTVKSSQGPSTWTAGMMTSQLKVATQEAVADRHSQRFGFSAIISSSGNRCITEEAAQA